MKLLKYDLIGIGLMIFGLTMSFAYLAMHNFEKLKHMTVSLTAVLLVSNLLIQLTPCYGADHFHSKRLLMFIAMIVFGLGLIAFCRIQIANTHEVSELYNRVYWGMIYLAIGFIFYVTHMPERFLTTCFGKKKSSRWIRELIQLLCPSHALWHIGVFGNGYGIYWAIYYFNRHVETCQL